MNGTQKQKISQKNVSEAIFFAKERRAVIITLRILVKKFASDISLAMSWLRGEDSNLRPLGYEPNELPLLHPAMFCGAKVLLFSDMTMHTDEKAVFLTIFTGDWALWGTIG